MGWEEITVGEVTFPAAYGPVLKISRCHNFATLADRYKSNSLYQPLIMILCMKFGWNLMETVEEGVAFRKSQNRKFCKCTGWPQTKLKQSDKKSTLHMCTLVPRVLNFRPFRSMVSHFRDIPHFRFSHWLPSCWNFKVPQNFDFWQNAKISITFLGSECFWTPET